QLVGFRPLFLRHQPHAEQRDDEHQHLKEVGEHIGNIGGVVLQNHREIHPGEEIKDRQEDIPHRVGEIGVKLPFENGEHYSSPPSSFIFCFRSPSISGI